MGLEIHILANIYIGQLEHSQKSYFVSRLKPEVMVVKHSILEQNWKSTLLWEVDPKVFLRLIDPVWKLLDHDSRVLCIVLSGPVVFSTVPCWPSGSLNSSAYHFPTRWSRTNGGKLLSRGTPLGKQTFTRKCQLPRWSATTQRSGQGCWFSLWFWLWEDQKEDWVKNRSLWTCRKRPTAMQLLWVLEVELILYLSDGLISGNY